LVQVANEHVADLDGDAVLRAVRLEHLAGSLGALLDRLEVLEAELGLDGRDVSDGVDAVLDVDDVLVLEAADDVRDRVDLADVGQELIAEALALRGATDEAGDVD